uniref:ARAD1D01980p n=1 Tax=Blastobotrys adeninivorans TaxID=409370 RepID=A0A060T7T0_BLAAD
MSEDAREPANPVESVESVESLTPEPVNLVMKTADDSPDDTAMESHVREESGEVTSSQSNELHTGASDRVNYTNELNEVNEIETKDDHLNIEDDSSNKDADTHIQAAGEDHITHDDNEEEKNDNNKEDEVPVQGKEEEEDDEFGDFDDAEFGEFDDFEAAPEPAEPTQPGPSVAGASEPSVMSLKEGDFTSSAQLQSAVGAILGSMTVQTTDSSEHGPNIHSRGELDSSAPNSYFSERSASLWSQLAVLSPDVRPIDWKRSAIRRLLLVSLGVPLDLDEILPRANTKRLVLPSLSKDTDKGKVPERDQSSEEKSTNTGTKEKEAESEALSKETEAFLSEWGRLAKVSQEALEGMNEEELNDHIDRLKTSIEGAEKLNAQWEAKKEGAIKDKEAFEGVIESLVEYAQRLRKK